MSRGVTSCVRVLQQGYNLGISSLMDAILKNQFLQVSLAASGTCSGEKFSTKHIT